MEYIDLGLPSGNLWATENEEGYYTFDEAVAKFGDCLPTKEDFEELVAHCWKRWDNEREGMEFMGDNGTKLFLSAAGCCYYSKEASNVGYIGYYWSSTPCEEKYAYGIGLSYNEVGMTYNYRRHGRSVRLIKRGGTQ